MLIDEWWKILNGILYFAVNVGERFRLPEHLAAAESYEDFEVSTCSHQSGYDMSLFVSYHSQL
jgi:hypothetical protein